VAFKPQFLPEPCNWSTLDTIQILSGLGVKERELGRRRIEVGFRGETSIAPSSDVKELDLDRRRTEAGLRGDIRLSPFCEEIEPDLERRRIELGLEGGGDSSSLWPSLLDRELDRDLRRPVGISIGPVDALLLLPFLACAAMSI
jgi:hypothetical protein